MLKNWKFDVGLLIFFIFISVIMLKFNIVFASIILAFLPSIHSTIYNNSEHLQLFICKLLYKNKSVGLKLNIKKVFKNPVDVMLDENILNGRLKKELKNNNISVGEENNKLRIERQIIKYKGDTINIRIPFIFKVQIEDDEIVLYISNYVNPIKYGTIFNWLNEAKYIWDFVEEALVQIIKKKTEFATYECEFLLDKNKFKKVYLANFVDEHEITELNMIRNDCNIIIKNNKLKIKSTSKKSFIKEVNKYSKFSMDFFSK